MAKLYEEDIEDEDIEVVIEDDTPEEDRDREPMPDDIVESLENDDLEQYDSNVKERMRQMKKVWHDERRAKEAADRERQVAIDATRQLMEENRRLRDTLSQGEKEYVQTVQVAAQLALDSAKRNLREAHESGETDRIIQAQETFSEAVNRSDRAKNFSPNALQTVDNNVKDTQDTSRHNVPDANTQAWLAKNNWFNRIEPMTAKALDIHHELAEKYGAEFVGTEKYYTIIDARMRKSNPEYFGVDDKPNGTQTSKRKATVVAPATRTTASKQVTLNQSQLRVASRLGLTPEQYAREAKKLEMLNG